MEREKALAIAAARAAGDIIRTIYETDYTIEYKRDDNSPVTLADQEANRKIHAMLQAAFPDYGWLSEETVDSSARLTAHRVWVVDPMDGTKEFIQKIPEFAVSIGLIEAGWPLLGVVYNPSLDQLFWAVRGQGAWCGGRPLRVPETPDLAEATILSSRSETKRGGVERFRCSFSGPPHGEHCLQAGMESEW